jgi:hypothetical protein
VGETSFSKLNKVTDQAKALIESWSVNDNNSVRENISFNPVVPNMMDRMNNNNNTVSSQDYQTYGWLFGTGRR